MDFIYRQINSIDSLYHPSPFTFLVQTNDDEEDVAKVKPRQQRRSPRQQDDAAQRLSTILTILAGIATVLAVLGSFTVYVWTTSRNVATVPYVDDSFKAALKHSDEKSSEMLQRAIDHADKNREATMEQVKEMNAAQREQMARVSTTLQNVVETLHDLRQDQLATMRKR
jgi:hypothetical protein